MQASLDTPREENDPPFETGKEPTLPAANVRRLEPQDDPEIMGGDVGRQCKAETAATAIWNCGDDVNTFAINPEDYRRYKSGDYVGYKFRL